MYRTFKSQLQEHWPGFLNGQNIWTHFTKGGSHRWQTNPDGQHQHRSTLRKHKLNHDETPLLAPQSGRNQKAQPPGLARLYTAGSHAAGRCAATSLCKELAFSSKINTSLVTQPSPSCFLPMRSRHIHTWARARGRGLPRETPRHLSSTSAADARELCWWARCPQWPHPVLPPTASGQLPGILRAGVSCHFPRVVLCVWSSYILLYCLALKNRSFFHRISSILLANTFVIFICFIFWFSNHLQLIFFI